MVGFFHLNPSPWNFTFSDKIQLPIYPLTTLLEGLNILPRFNLCFSHNKVTQISSSLMMDIRLYKYRPNRCLSLVVISRRKHEFFRGNSQELNSFIYRNKDQTYLETSYLLNLVKLGLYEIWQYTIKDESLKSIFVQFLNLFENRSINSQTTILFCFLFWSDTNISEDVKINGKFVDKRNNLFSF
jgi:hypothetical protein